MENHLLETYPSHLGDLNRDQAQFHRPDVVTDPLYVIVPIFNSQRYRTRWKLANQFFKHVIDSGAILVTIEAAFGQRAEVVVQQLHPRHIKISVRTTSEIWIKENLYNLAVQRLPKDAKYVALVDGDVKFLRYDWVGETIQQLQRYDMVQMFSVAVDVTPKFEPYCFNYSFMHDYVTGHTFWGGQTTDPAKNNPYYYQEPAIKGNGIASLVNRWHPGFAWACTIEAFGKLGGLIDQAILGAADHHMALALIGKAEFSLPGGVSDGYRDMVLTWQENAIKELKMNVGYVEGAIHHFFHGAKTNRRYKERWSIITDNKYDPRYDLKRDWNGVWQLTDRNLKLRDQIRQYMKERDEDNLDMMGVPGLLG